MAEGHEAKNSRDASGSQINISHEQGNWLTVARLICEIQKPIATYVEQIVKDYHQNLCEKLPAGECQQKEICNKKPDDLCESCQRWLTKLKESHRTGNNPAWQYNCNSSKWSEDPWEVAKFFMPRLGSSIERKDAKSTDLSSLLNVLEWMKNEAFLGRTRVDIDLVRKLRSQVRNTWAHAPKQEFDNNEKSESFSIAMEFLRDLEKKFPNTENEKCKAILENLVKDGVTIVAESELQALRQLQQRFLDVLTSCLPDKIPNFTARKNEIKKVISFLIDEGKAVVSLHGKPGFGKSAIANEVCHKLSEDHNVSVVFSQLTTATTVDEMVRRLCRDVGVYYGVDPKSSLISWLKNITNKVIFVLDDIDEVLKRNSTLHGFVRLLRKNSNHHCQIVTTSEDPFKILDLTTGEVEVGKMDEKSCMELLNKLCSEQDDDKCLQKLADLCGNIPLAMCIAASHVKYFENINELLRHLENQPLENIESTNYDRHISRAINIFYSKCPVNERDMLLYLAIFEGSFSEEAAIAVGGDKNNELSSKRILENLITGNWVKKSTKHRYSIHHSFKRFLKYQLKGETEKEKRAHAEVMMVEYYLKLGHDLTLETYSKDGYKQNRDALKQEEHHIQNVLNICCRKDVSSDILDCLAESEIYNNSARFFALLARTIISGFIVQNFLEKCEQLAKERKQCRVKINFDCLLAGQERNKLFGKSDKDFTLKMEKLQEEFEANYEDLKQDKSLCAHYYYQQGRYLMHTSQNHIDEESLESQKKARAHLKKSLNLRNTLINTTGGKADVVFALLHVGKACKIISTTAFYLKKMEESRSSSEQAQEYYKEAIRLSEDHLGGHELTAACYKSLGDIYLENDDPGRAEEKYTIAKKMRENLGLDARKRYVSLLNSLGICLTKLKRENEAIEELEIALDRAESLTEKEMLHHWKSEVHNSLGAAHNALNARRRMEWDAGH